MKEFRCRHRKEVKNPEETFDAKDSRSSNDASRNNVSA